MSLISRNIIPFLAASVFVLAAAARIERSVSGQGRDYLLVLNKQESSLNILDGNDYRLLSRLATGEGPHELTVSADGRRAYVANYGTPQNPGSTISVIDVAAGKELRRASVAPLGRPHGIVEAGGFVYFTTELTRTVARYDPAGDRVDWVMGTGQTETHLLAISPDRSKLFTADRGSDTVTSIEFLSSPPGATRLTRITVGRQPEGIDISPDGRELWVGHNGDGKISIIDVETGKVKEVISAGEMPIRIKFTRDGRRVAVSDARKGELALFDAASRKEVGRVRIGQLPVGILIPPDNRRIFAADSQANRVIVVNLADLSISYRIETGAGPDGMAWSHIE